MYVRDPNSEGLVMDVSVAILSDYIDALVAGECCDIKEFLKHAPATDQKTLAGLFELAGELKDMYSHEYVPDALAKERIWEEINRRFES